MYLKNVSNGPKGIVTKGGQTVYIDAGATSADIDVDDAELDGVDYFKKGSAKDAPAEADATVLGEPGPGDPPKPEDAPENEVAAPATGNRRQRG